jgi:hypothetical protein
VYNQNLGEKRLDINFISQKTDFEIFDEMGICTNVKKPEDDLIECIISAVELERPVVLYIDSFFEPFRIDTYKKHHWPHTILIFGYDSKNKQFHIVEHHHRDSLSYRKRSINFIDIVKAYNGYKEYLLKDSKINMYMEFYTDNRYGTSSIDYKKRLRLNSENWMGQISEGIEKLRQFAKDFSGFLENAEDNILPFVNDYVKVLSKIIDSRKVEKYKILKVLGCQSLLEEDLSNIINYWNEIRTSLIKFSVDPMLKDGVFNGHIDKIMQIYAMEKKYQNDFWNKMRVDLC